jgi:hypothetical protein
MKYFAIIIILLIVCSCRDKTINKKNITAKNVKITSASNKAVYKKLQEEIEKSDSIKLNEVLENALNFGKKNINSNFYKKNYDTLINDSTIVKVEIKLGWLFSKNNKHILICRTSYDDMYFDIFKIEKGQFEHVLNFKNIYTPDFANHSIKDVNGDGLKDFIVHWYPSSGCCRRNIYDVFLNLNKSGRFTAQYRFINPTFSIKEKIIRGVLYGHPGEVGLYKYKWNGFNTVDTIEFIYPDRSDTLNRHYIKTVKRLYSSKNIKKINLKSVPKEYLNIESFEWFNDY